HWIGHGALEENVKAAPILLRSFALLAFDRVCVTQRRDIRRQMWPDARSTDGWIQQTRGGEVNIPDVLCFEAKAGLARKQDIVRVAPYEFRARGGRLAIGGRSNNELYEGLAAPVVAAEVRRRSIDPLPANAL